MTSILSPKYILAFSPLISLLGIYFEEIFTNTKTYTHRHSSEQLMLIVENQTHPNCSTRRKSGALPKGLRKTLTTFRAGQWMAGNSCLCQGVSTRAQQTRGQRTMPAGWQGDVSSLQIMHSNHNS